MTRTLLITVGAVAAAIWVGGIVVVALVAATVRGQLSQPEQIEFFRTFGRRYLVLSGCALGLAYACGTPLLLLHGGWSDRKSWIVALALALVAATGAGVAQARRLTQVRRGALSYGGGTTVTAAGRDARAALALRLAIAVITVALVILVAAAAPS